MLAARVGDRVRTRYSRPPVMADGRTLKGVGGKVVATWDVPTPRHGATQFVGVRLDTGEVVTVERAELTLVGLHYDHPAG